MIQENAPLNFSKQEEKDSLVKCNPNKTIEINGRNSLDTETKLNIESKSIPEKDTIKVYHRRWFLLILFIIITTLNGIQWCQYSIITNITMRYYGISARMVDYTSLIYLITYLPLVLPASYLMDKYGLRFTLIAAALGNCIGCWLKVPSVDPDKFYIGFIGQFVLSCTQLLIISTPASFAAVWFGADEVSTACALGVFGQQLGMALGFILPPLLINNHEDLELIGRDFYRFFLANALITTAVLLLTIMVCQKQPKFPPSRAQALLREGSAAVGNSMGEIIKSFKRLLKEKSYVTLLCVFGITLGIFNAFCTFLNQIILLHFPDAQVFAGQIGLVITIAGMIGSSIIGYIMDKTKAYKITAVSVLIMSTVGLFCFIFSLKTKTHALVFVTSGFLGLFLTTFISVAFEFAVELTYPEAEANAVGLMVSCSQSTGVIGILLFGWIIENYGEFWYNVGLTIFMSLSVVLTLLISNKLKRQAVSTNVKEYELTSVNEEKLIIKD